MCNPEWLPHRIDWTAGQVAFLRIARERLERPGFLADLNPVAADEEVRLPIGQVATIEPATGPLHFIFHTAFCRSTLLVRALSIAGVSAGMAEPGIFAGLVAGGQQAQPLVKPILDLLSRPWGEGEAVIVKPTNHANALIPALLAARPDAKAVLMTNPLKVFLGSVVRKGLMGRRWGRKLYLELQGYAPLDLGMDSRETFALTDMQAAGLAWFLNQRYFDALVKQYGERVRVLDGDRFDAQREKTLSATATFFDLDLSDDRAKKVANGPVFARHAKLGGDFGQRDGHGRDRAIGPLVQDEIAKTAEWTGMIAAQAGLAAPVQQTLF